VAEANVTWTDERLDLLKKLWSEGLSASQIAAQLGGGVSRNAVLGKCHRLGLVREASTKAPAVGSSVRRQEPSSPVPIPIPLEGRRPEQQASTPRTSTASHEPAKQPEMGVLLRDASSPDPAGLTIMELRESMCRWPLGDPTTPAFRYCGAGAVPGLPYCSHHAQIAYQPAANRKRLRA
jgi:GcrA cell cycle regulator